MYLSRRLRITCWQFWRVTFLKVVYLLNSRTYPRVLFQPTPQSCSTCSVVFSGHVGLDMTALLSVELQSQYSSYFSFKISNRCCSMQPHIARYSSFSVTVTSTTEIAGIGLFPKRCSRWKIVVYTVVFPICTYP